MANNSSTYNETALNRFATKEWPKVLAFIQ